jgi:hypothetical protein
VATSPQPMEQFGQAGATPMCRRRSFWSPLSPKARILCQLLTGPYIASKLDSVRSLPFS